MKAPKIPNEYAGIIKKISETAKEEGFSVYAVGGFVRDLFIKRFPNDLDIMVEPLCSSQNSRLAGINFSKVLASKYSLGNPVIFERFGTAKLFIDGREVEFVMPRKEYYEDSSRNPDTDIGTLEQDALRRDFTINALFLRLNDNEILDLTLKGAADIKNKIIRVADSSAADIIFKQDPLRILRAVRQSLQLGFAIEPNTYEAMKNSVKRIKIVSPERIRDELNKILSEKFPSTAFRMMETLGLLLEILPDIAILKGLTQPEKYHIDDVFGHTLSVVDRVKNVLVLRLAALLHDAGKFAARKDENGKISFIGHEKQGAEIAQRVLKELKYPKIFISQISLIIENHLYPKMYERQWSYAAVRRFAARCGGELENILELSKADYGRKNDEDALKSLKERIEELKSRDALIRGGELLSGTQLMRRFSLPQGGWIKQAKEIIAQERFENPNLTEDEAFGLIKRKMGL
ncbi:MAG: CCA tRNA nucleotidyltransferase [Endomicrobium sp.]|jgi:putative nucleotidyltransferase with HDIG domain|nr:CCA tRNA nucleotidyltransferase [Endomicrobium sp.]